MGSERIEVFRRSGSPQVSPFRRARRTASSRLVAWSLQREPARATGMDEGMVSPLALHGSINNDTATLVTQAMADDRYTCRITWFEDEQEWVGLCAEFPRLSHFDDSPEAALAGIRAVVATGLELLRERGQEPPEPLATKRYSGKFMVRVPPAIHRLLALEAAEQGVSLNRLVASKLG